VPIDFDTIPTTDRVPFVYIEFDNTNAIQAAATQVYSALMLGQRNAGTATVAASVPTRVSSLAQMQAYFGADSMLAQMARVWFANNGSTPLTVIASDDNGAGTKSTATVTVTGPATAAGTLSFYVGGQQHLIGVTSGMTATQVATALAAAINADTTCPVGAASAAGVVTLTTNWKGISNMGPGSGYDLDLRINYQSGDATPAGLAVVIAQTAPGTGNPDLTAAIAAMGDTQYNIIVNPYTDATALGLLVTEMNRRGGSTLQAEGVVFSCYAATVGNLETFGAAQNSQWLSVMGKNSMPTPSWEFAAGVAALVAYYGNIDPARPFQTLAVPGVFPPAPGDRFVMADRNTLLYTGISTFTVSAAGVVALERIITTYQTNGAGAPDASYLDVNTMLTLSYLRYSTRVMIQTKYPRSKLADDGIIYSPGQNVVTPKTMKAELVALCQQWADAALVENVDAFAAGLIVERNSTNPNRLDILIDPQLVSGFLIAAVQIQFVLLAAAG